MEMTNEILGRWDIFESCLDSDETKLLSGDVGKKMSYNVKNIGNILPQTPIFHNPSIYVVQSESGNTAIAVDGFLHIVEEGDDSPKAIINIGCRVDSLCFCPDGSMVIVVDNSGVIHLVSIATGKVMFSHKFVEFDEKTRIPLQFNKKNNMFCSVTCSENERNKGFFFIGVALTSSEFYVFSNIKLHSLKKAHITKDVELMKSLQVQMNIKSYNVSDVHNNAITDMIGFNDGFCQKFITIGRGDGCVSLWSQDFDPFVEIDCDESSPFTLNFYADSDLFYEDGNISIVKSILIEDHLYALDSKGCMFLLDIKDLIVLRLWKHTKIKEFAIVKSGSVNLRTNIHGMNYQWFAKLYTIVTDASGYEKFCVLQLPTMTPIFEYPLQQSTFQTIAFGSPFLEDILFVSCEDRGNLSVCLNQVSEASPEDRVRRLINNRRFDEAEKFALALNVDIQQVYFGKASYLSAEISGLSENDQSSLETMFLEFIKCLKKLNDGIAVVKFCLETIIPDVKMNYQLLSIGQSRLNYNDVDRNEHEKELVSEIIHRMDRLVTFRIAGYNQKDWIRFCNTDLPLELVRLLDAGNMSASAIVLSRHKACLLNFLDRPTCPNPLPLEKRLEEFLEHVPDTTDVDQVVHWLENSLLPTLLPKFSCSLKVLASWLHMRAESYEHSQPSEWPENGIKMTNVLFNVQSRMSVLGFTRALPSATSPAFKSTSEEVAKLRLLSSRLQVLLQLKQNYKCNITLSEFAEETTLSLTYRMLDRVMVPELMSSVLQQTVRPYMREHNLSEEEVLLGYVEDLFSRFHSISRGSMESLMQRRIIAILQCITDSQVLLKATVKLAKGASVPWSEDIHLLVNNGIKMAQSANKDTGDTCANMDGNSKFLKELQYWKHIEQLPGVLAEHGLFTIDIKNPSSLMQVVRFLICQNTKESLTQANHFRKTFTTISDIDMYRFRLVYLLGNNKVNDCVDLLIEAEKEKHSLDICLVKHIICLAETYLDDLDDINIEDRVTHCSAAISMIEHILHRLESGKLGSVKNFDNLDLFLREKLELLENISKLQVKCSEVVSVDEYKDEKFRSSLVSKYIESYSSSFDFATSSKSTSANESKHIITSTEDAFLRRDKILDIKDFHDTVDTPATNLSQILNIASILQTPSDKLRGWIALNAAKKGGFGISTALHLCRDQLRISPNEEVAQTTFQVVIESMNQLPLSSKKILGVIQQLLELSAEAMMHCKSEKIIDGMGMCNILTLCNGLQRVTDNRTESDIFVRESISKKNPFAKLTTLCPYMEEDNGLMLQLHEILPTFTQTCKNFLNSSHCDIAELQQLTLTMTTILQNSQQTQLSLLWMIMCVGSSMRRLASRWNPLDKEESNKVLEHLLSMLEGVDKMLSEHIDNCITKVLNAKVVDVDLIIGLLTLMSKSKPRELLQGELNKAGKDCKKILAIAKAGIAIMRLNLMDQEERFQNLFLSSRWGKTLQPMQIPYDHAHFSHQSYRRELLDKLIYHRDSEGQLLVDFCLDFDMDITSTLIEYTRVLLSDPSCLVKTEIQKLKSGDGILVSPSALHLPFDIRLMKWENQTTKPQCEEPDANRPWSSVKKELAFVRSRVSDKRKFCQQLVKILRLECSPYYYKRAKFLLNLIEDCNNVQSEVDVKKGIELIECLKLIKRCSTVSAYERENWNIKAESGTSHKLPEISAQRLPLHPLLFGDASVAWKIINPELNKNSALKLEPIVRILSLSSDKMFMTAADNFIRTHIDKNEGNVSFSLEELKDVRSLTDMVQDLRMKTAIAKRIAQLLPISEQKVEICEWCFRLSEQWLTELPKDAVDYSTVVNTCKILKSFYLSVATEHALQKNDLVTESVMSLAHSPKNLIHLLYQHPSIIHRYYKPDAEKYPDIHSAANEIAEIHSVNIFQLRMSICMEWLLSDDSTSQANDDDLTINIANMKAIEMLNKSPGTSLSMCGDVIRLLYVLSHMLTKQTAKYLLGFAFDRNNPRLMNRSRVRALQCVLILFNDDVIEELTNSKAPEIREKLRLLFYLTEFDAIGFSIPGAEFQKRKKDEVARSIFASPRFQHNPRAIRVAAELCREYNTWCPNTWQLLLQQLVTLRQVCYLRHLLRDIGCHDCISSLPCFSTVWKTCVTLPLDVMTPPLSEEEVEAAVVSYNFLIDCPVLLQTNLISIAQQFLSIELPLLALGCLLVDQSQDENATKLIMSDHALIQDQLKLLPSIHGHAMINNVLQTCRR
ncbi:kinetochore-associated protein 1-like [Styela clava]